MTGRVQRLARVVPDDLALGWIYRDRRARMILDAAHSIMWSNASADAELAQNRELARRGALLVLADHARQAALVRFLATCAEAANSFCLPCSEGAGHIVFKGEPIAASANGMVIGLTFHRSAQCPAPEYANLQQVFQLTPTEYRVLREMIDGHTADSAAEQLRISIDTIRYHIRHIYQKLNVTSREAMFNRIQPYRL